MFYPIQLNSYSEGSNTPCTSSCNPWNFGLCHSSSKAFYPGWSKRQTKQVGAAQNKTKQNKTNPERKTNKHLMNPVSNCQALLLPAIIIMFLSRRSNLSVAACHTCDSFLHSDSQWQKTKVLWTIKKYLCRSSLSLSLSLSLCACVQLSTPKSKETQMEPCVTKESYL
jgi:hypothetical protein